MKKIILILSVLSINSAIFAQSTQDLDNSIDTIWEQSQNPSVLQQLGPDGMSQERISLIPPTPTRSHIPGNSIIPLPTEESKGPLNASPDDPRAYILYNRATIAFQNNQQESARSLYRELIRRYPNSSYTPYALYVLSLSETDFRRKVRILQTIKEKFPTFPSRDIIIDALGELYYLLGSLESAEEVLAESKTYKSYYLQATMALDKRNPNKAITMVRKALNQAPNNEAAYKIYMIYAEALIALKSYNNALTILQKAITLRPWAYDNGVSILLNAGKAFYHNGLYPQSLYTFSVLRLRFSRTTEARLSDQYIESLSKKGTVEMTPVPWIAKNFDTLIQKQPTITLTQPQTLSISDMQKMHNLPATGVAEPNVNDLTFVPPMPIPVPPKNRYDVLVPIQDTNLPNIDIITVTNTVLQTVTNSIEQLFTNRIFVVETNTFSNNFAQINQSFQTNTVVETNILQVVETNNVIAYEPIILWKTNYRQIDFTNLVTNVIDVVVTNERLELLPLQKTNYNFVNRDKNITNILVRPITNRYLEYGLNNQTNWREEIVNKRFVEIIPAWKTTYQTIDTNSLVTNVITEILTNRRLELVPRWISNLRTNSSYEIVDRVITNRRLRIAPRWVTNLQVIQTNVRDVVLTNVVNIVQTNHKDFVLTNVKNDVRVVVKTNVKDFVVTNIVNTLKTFVKTNYKSVVLTNYINNIRNINHTNVIDTVVTNVINNIRTIEDTNIVDAVVTNVIHNFRTIETTNIIDAYITNIYTNVRNIDNTNLVEAVITNVYTNTRYLDHTNIIDAVITNVYTNVRNIDNTNLVEAVVTNVYTNVKYINNTNIIDAIITNVVQNFQTVVHTNLTEAVITNVRNVVHTNIIDDVITNSIGVLRTNTVEQILTNIMNVVQTNFVERVFTNTLRHSIETTNISTNQSQEIITNYLGDTSILETAQIQFAPSELNRDLDSQINSEEQIALLTEPLYTTPVEEEQIKFVSQEVTQLERLASQLAEKSAGIAGEYGFSDNKGYVIRIIEVKDLSVANIVLRDISKLDLGIPAGIYYRDGVYYIEMRAIKDKDLADKIFQKLYQLGYTNIQLFEQYEVTEFQE